MSLRSPERKAMQTAIRARCKTASSSLAEHQNHYSQLEAKREKASKRAKVAQANLEEVEANMTEARAKVFMAVTEVDLANTSQLEFLQLHRREAISADEAKETVREEAHTERANVYQEFESAPEVEHDEDP